MLDNQLMNQHLIQQLQYLQSVQQTNSSSVDKCIKSFDRLNQISQEYKSTNIPLKWIKLNLTNRLDVLNQHLKSYNTNLYQGICQSNSFINTNNNDYQYLAEQAKILNQQTMKNNNKFEKLYKQNVEKQCYIEQLMSQVQSLQHQEYLFKLNQIESNKQKLAFETHKIDRMLAFQNANSHQDIYNQSLYSPSFTKLKQHFSIQQQTQNKSYEYYSKQCQNAEQLLKYKRNAVEQYNKLRERITNLNQANRTIEESLKDKIQIRKSEIDLIEADVDKKIQQKLFQQLPSYQISLKSWQNAFHEIITIMKKEITIAEDIKDIEQRVNEYCKNN